MAILKVTVWQCYSPPNYDRVVEELNRVLGFRGHVIEDNFLKSGKLREEIKVEVSPKWDISEDEKVEYLKEWIPAKVRTSLKVTKVEEAV